MDTKQLNQELNDQDRLLVVFGYLGPLALVSLLATRREFVKWHAKQGLVLSAALVALYFILRFVRFVLDWPLLSFFQELFSAAIWLSILGVGVAILVCIIRGLEGERYKIPMVGDLADRL